MSGLPDLVRECERCAGIGRVDNPEADVEAASSPRFGEVSFQGGLSVDAEHPPPDHPCGKCRGRGFWLTDDGKMLVRFLRRFTTVQFDVEEAD